MKQGNAFGAVVRDVRGNLGQRVRISENKGRNKVDVTEGVIAEIYPFFFMVQVDEAAGEAPKTVTFQYSDVFTKDIEMVVC